MRIGCSSFSWDTLDGKHLLGRTYDQYGDLSENRIAVVPAGISMPSMLEADGDRFQVRYSFVGMAILGLSAPIFADGVNEAGLMGGLLNYPGCGVYEQAGEDKRRGIHPGFFLGYLLGSFSGVEEAVKGLSNIRFADAPVFGEKMQVHYLLCDRTGEAVIIEPDAGGIKVHRDTIGVMTNSPDYIWHRTNLRNYGGVFYGEGERKLLNMRLTGFGEALGGGFGLPGDYSSPSRFVRVAALKEVSVKGKDEIDGISRMFHIFSAVSVPEGILRAPKEEKGYEKTLCISGMCAESGAYYFSVAENRRICVIRPGEMEPDGEIRYFRLPVREDLDDWTGKESD